MIETFFEALRFGSTGVAATLLHLLIAFAAAKGMDLSPYAANAAGFASAFIVSYLGHFYWTFGHRAGHRRYLARFRVLSLSGYGLSNLIIWLVVERAGLPFVLALPWIALAVPAFTFLSAKYWAFSDKWIRSFVSNETLVLTADFAAYAKGMEKPRILVLSSNLSAAFPFVNAVHGEWTSSYPTQWIVPGAVEKLASCENASPDCGKTRKALAFARDSAVRDFLKGAPVLVYVDIRPRKPYFGGIPFDYLSWLEQDHHFAERWKNYTKIGETDGYAVWSLRHIDQPSA